MDVYKLIREGERRALKAYFSGEPLEQVCRRFGYSRVRIKAMAEDYKSGKIDIFGPMDKKKFDKQFKEVDQLKARVAELGGGAEDVEDQGRRVRDHDAHHPGGIRD
jgi:hypothetical protein